MIEYHETVLRLILFSTHPVFFIFLIAVAYWRGHRRTFTHVLILLIVTMCLNQWLKSAMQIPPMPGLTGWRFPSGHSQTTAVFWLWLGSCCQNIYLWCFIAMLLWIIPIGLIHFKYHLMIDVVTAYLLAACTVYMYRTWITQPKRDVLSPGYFYIGLVVVGTIWLISFPGIILIHLYWAISFLCFFLVGYHRIAKTIPPLSYRACLYGLIGINILYVIAHAIDHFALWWITYVGIAYWISIGYPNYIETRLPFYHSKSHS